MHRIASTFVSISLLASVASAQHVRDEALTGWSHTGGTWSADVTATGSLAPKVAQLTGGPAYSYRGVVSGLAKGTYVLTARLQKFKDQVGVAPVHVDVIGVGGKVSETLPVLQQVTGKWVYTPAAVFQTSGTTTPTVVTIYSTTATVANYWFDSVRIGKVPEGKVLKYQSLAHNQWKHAWGSPYYTAQVANKSSAFGEVEQFNSVWWLEFYSNWVKPGTKRVYTNPIVLQPGTYTANTRIQKTVSASGSAIFELFALVDVGATTQTKVALAPWWNTSSLPIGQWVNSPNLTFQVTKKDTPVVFNFRDIASTFKRSYLFDSFMIRKGAFTKSGTACSTSLGKVSLDGSVPMVGETMTLSATSTPVAAVFLLGLQKVSVDMSSFGASGCTLYTPPFLNLVGLATKNLAAAQGPIPNLPGAIGITFYAQALALDAKANGFGAAFSELGTAKIEM